MNHYFITGGTGAVGSAIADELLSLSDTRVTLLLRAPTEADLADRIAHLCRFWGRDAASLGERLAALRGDTSLPHFALDHDAFERVARECTHVVHCAAAVRMNLSLDDARRSAVHSARNVMMLAEAGLRYGRLVKVEFVSTVGVAGRMAGLLPERLIDQPREYHNTYEQSKAEAEGVIAEAIARGMPITIHRPSMVVGDARSGRLIHFQVFYHLAEFLSGNRTFGFMPRLGDKTLDIVPVDYVSAAVTWATGQPITAGRVLHLCSGPRHAIALRALQAQVRSVFAAAGTRCAPVLPLPVATLRAMLPVIAAVSPQKVRRALETLPIFLEYLAEDQGFDNAISRKLLAEAGIPLPAPDVYLPRVLGYYLANKDGRRSGQSSGRADSRA